jgi:hypothetical protein
MDISLGMFQAQIHYEFGKSLITYISSPESRQKQRETWFLILREEQIESVWEQVAEENVCT